MNKLIIAIVLILSIMLLPVAASATDASESTSCKDKQYEEFTVNNETHVLCANNITTAEGSTAYMEHSVSQYDDSLVFVTMPSSKPDSYMYRGYTQPTTLHSYNLVDEEQEWNTTIDSYISEYQTTPGSDTIMVATAAGEIYSVNKQTGDINWKKKVTRNVYEVREEDEPYGFEVTTYGSGSHMFANFWLRGHIKTVFINNDGKILSESTPEKSPSVTGIDGDLVVEHEESTYRVDLDTGEIQWKNNNYDREDSVTSTFAQSNGNSYIVYSDTDEWVFLDLSSGRTHSAEKPDDRNMHSRLTKTITDGAFVVDYAEIEEPRGSLDESNKVVPVPSPRKVSIEAYSIADGDQLFSVSEEVRTTGDSNSDIYDNRRVAAKGGFVYFSADNSDEEFIVMDAKDGETYRVDAEEFLGLNDNNPIFQENNRIMSLDPETGDELWETQVDRSVMNVTSVVSSANEGAASTTFLVSLADGTDQIEYYTYAEGGELSVINFKTGSKETISFEREIALTHTYSMGDTYYVIPRNSSMMVSITDGTVSKTSIDNLSEETFWATGEEGRPSLVNRNFTLPTVYDYNDGSFTYDIYLRGVGQSTLEVSGESRRFQANDQVYFLETTDSENGSSDLIRIEFRSKAELIERADSSTTQNESTPRGTTNSVPEETENDSSKSEKTSADSETTEDNTQTWVEQPGFGILHMFATLGIISWLSKRRFSSK